MREMKGSMASPTRGEEEPVRIMKREQEGTHKSNSTRKRTEDVHNNNNDSTPKHGVLERRVIRSKYLAVKDMINDERDDISIAGSDKFNSIINQVESLHNLVQKPREQVADAEALLDIANTLALSVRSQINGGLTPSDFVSSLLQDFGQHNKEATLCSPPSTMLWSDIGLVVADVFRKAPGISTMIGSMDKELKPRKAVSRRHKIPTGIVCPKELDNTAAAEMTDTDKNMVTIFNVLKKKKSVKLEHLVLNRNSYAQTVENIFALSFLVKDGRVEIKVNHNNCHYVFPRNAPASSAVLSGEVAYNHFVFRFDFKDWKLMVDTVKEGEELMPHRNQMGVHVYPSSDSQLVNSQRTTTTIKAIPIRIYCRNRRQFVCQNTATQESPGNSKTTTTPIKTFSRNRGLVVCQNFPTEESPEKDAIANASPSRNVKRKLE